MRSWERTVSAERAVARLVRLAQEASTDDLSPREQAGLLRLETTLARQRLAPHRSGGARMWRFGAVGFAAAAAAIVLVAMGRRSVVPFEVANGSVSNGGYIRPTAAESTRVRFADGSDLVLEPGARTRVAEVYANGARVLLEEGKARVHVVPVRGAKWLVEAGPYTILVTGTAFEVAWSGTQEVLDLWLQKGSVTVTGPLTTRGLIMQAGQHLVARVRDSQLLLDGRPSEESGLASDSMAESPTLEPSVDSPPNVGHSKGGHAVNSSRSANAASNDEGRPLSWPKRLAAGDFEGILADAERVGIDSVLSKGSRSEVAALADAARYARRVGLARRALLAERERFLDFAQGKEAAFFLGGLAESEPSSLPSALDWYERYLTENPLGAYSSQASGRRMMIVHKLRGREAAKPLALEYLNQYATGPYARHARNLLENNAVK